MWTNLLYGWLILTNIATTGATWYASPPARWHGPYAVDEIEILLGSSERCLATATNATGHQAAPMRYVESIRGTNGMITVTNALTWQLAGRGMLVSNDAAFKAAIPFYLQTNSLPSPATNWFAPWTYTGLVASLGIGFSNWPYQVEFTNYEDRYKVLNMMEWTWREAVSTNMDWWYGTAQYETNDTTLNTSIWTEVYNAAVANYSLRTNEVGIMEQDCTKKWWLETNNVGSNIYQTNLLVTTVSNYIYTITGTNAYVTNQLSELITTNLTVSGSADAQLADYYGVWHERLYDRIVSGSPAYYRPNATVDAGLSIYSIFLTIYDGDDPVLYLWTNSSGYQHVGTYYPSALATNTLGVINVTEHSVEDVWPQLPTGIYEGNETDGFTNGIWTLKKDGFWVSLKSGAFERTLFGRADPSPWGSWTLSDGIYAGIGPTYNLGTSIVVSATNQVAITNNPVDPSGTYEPGSVSLWVKVGPLINQGDTNAWIVDKYSGYWSWKQTNGLENLWNPTNEYGTGETVDWHDSHSLRYTGLENINIGNVPHDSPTWWEVETNGNWLAGTVYASGATVWSGLIQYMAIDNSTNVSVSDTNYWRMLSEYTYYEHDKEGDYVIYLTNSGYANLVDVSWVPCWDDGPFLTGVFTAVSSDDIMITGTATVVETYLYEPVYETNIVYECSLRKVGANYYAYTGTDVAHAVQGFYVWPSVLTLLGSDSNVFFAHGLAITNDAWSEVYSGAGGFTNATENTEYFGGSIISTPPEEGPDPTETIPSVTYGFILNTAPRFVFEWDFIYGTNRFW